MFGSYLWGIETCLLGVSWAPTSLVWILPMRDWNVCTVSFLISPFCPFGSYLWGIETTFSSPFRKQIQRFGSYLWGIETRWFWKRMLGDVRCLDLTYEGLKQYVCLECDTATYVQFGSYLWGIETGRVCPALWSPIRLDLTYEGLKLRFRLN